LGGKNEFGLIQSLRNQDSEPEEGKLTYVTKQIEEELKNEESKDKIVQVQVKRLTAM
jgi:hypothetical protein